MRRVNAPITVKTTSAGTPASFEYRGRAYRITSVVDRWLYTGRWWLGEGTWIFWRVLADDGEFELFYDEAEDEWRLYRIYD